MGFNKPRLAKIRPEAFVLSFGLLAAPASRLSLCVFLVASPICAPPPPAAPAHTHHWSSALCLLAALSSESYPEFTSVLTYAALSCEHLLQHLSSWQPASDLSSHPWHREQCLAHRGP